MKKKKYLVTGGTGFIGSSLVRRLVKEGHRVRVLDNQSRGSAARLADVAGHFEFVRADIRETSAVDRAMKGMDAVCHLAFVNGTEFFYTRPELVLDVGVKGMVNVIDACLKRSVPEIILASSSEVYQTPPRVPTDESAPLSVPDPWNPRYSYGGAKIISELMTLNFGRRHFRRAVIFRPHNVFGADMGWEHVVPQFVLRMKKLAAKCPGAVRFPVQGTGRETRAFIYIDDFTDGLLKVIEKGEHLGIYHIGTTEELEIREVAREVGAYFGRAVRVVPGKAAAGGTSRRCPDIRRLKALGFRPKYSFRQALPAVAKWYDENAGKAPKHP